MVVVVPGEVFPLRCTVTGVGATRALLGVPTRFTVETRDEHGNLLDKGGRDVSVRIDTSLVRRLRTLFYPAPRRPHFAGADVSTGQTPFGCRGPRCQR
jgi:hypothetical protein